MLSILTVLSPSSETTDTMLTLGRSARDAHTLV